MSTSDSLLQDDTRRTLLEEVLVRAWVILVAIPTRTLDVAHLARHPRLLRAYLRLWWAELRQTPYRWPRSFEAVRALKRVGQGPRELIYGETPLCTAVGFLRRAGLGPGDRFVDPLAGRGRVLLAARRLGAEALGVELYRRHVAAAGGCLAEAGAALRCDDGARREHFADATHVFLAWTGLTPSTKARFEAALEALPAGARVLTLSEPSTADHLRLAGQARVLTAWGPETLYFHERVPAEGRARALLSETAAALVDGALREQPGRQAGSSRAG